MRCTAASKSSKKCRLHSKHNKFCHIHDQKKQFICQCPICLEDIYDISYSKFISLPCTHTFHTKCIDKWKNKNNTCPMCRALISSDVNIKPIYSPTPVRRNLYLEFTGASSLFYTDVLHTMYLQTL